LLFDDVMSELDERCQGYPSGYFLGSSQAVITTNLEYFEGSILEKDQVIFISEGSGL